MKKVKHQEWKKFEYFDKIFIKIFIKVMKVTKILLIIF